MLGQILKLIQYIYIYVHILLISVCVFGACSFWQGKVVIPVDTQRVYQFSTLGLAGVINQDVYLW